MIIDQILAAIGVMIALFAILIARKHRKEDNATLLTIDSSLKHRGEINNAYFCTYIVNEGKTIYVKSVRLVSGIRNPFELPSDEAMISGLSKKNRLETGEPSEEVCFCPYKLMDSFFSKNETFIYKWLFLLFCHGLSFEVTTTNNKVFYRKANKEIRSWLWHQYKNDPRVVAK